jgi:hypothetical protein
MIHLQVVSPEEVHEPLILRFLQAEEGEELRVHPIRPMQSLM